MRRRLVRGQQRGDDLRVRRRAEAHALLAQLGVQLDGVDEVAVVAERELAAVGAMDRLRVVPAVRAGRRVAHVADRDLAAERAQLLLVEDLVDEAEVAQGHDVTAYVRGGDAGGFLPAVLQCVQREVGQARDVVAGRVDPEHSALVTRPLAAIERGHRSKDSLAFGGELSIATHCCTGWVPRAAQVLHCPGISPNPQHNEVSGRWNRTVHRTRRCCTIPATLMPIDFPIMSRRDRADARSRGRGRAAARVRRRAARPLRRDAQIAPETAARDAAVGQERAPPSRSSAAVRSSVSPTSVRSRSCARRCRSSAT